MKKKFVIVICFIASLVSCSVDDKTSSFAFSVAKQFGLAVSNKQFQCPFPKDLSCDPEVNVRSFDGTCNNLRQPFIGSSQTPHKRVLSPEYDDGISSPRTKSLSGKKLPNPRGLSLNLSSDPFNIQELIWSHLWVIFGQFLTHDIAATALSNCMIKFFSLLIF